MESKFFRSGENGPIDGNKLREILKTSLSGLGENAKKVLLLPPDLTRGFSKANDITNVYYELLKDRCDIDIMPAIGTHFPMTDREIRDFFGENIPLERFLVHNWRSEVVKIGEVPGELVSRISGGRMDTKIDVEVNRRIVGGEYDLIISIGQVVPHELIGMANYSKNIFVGCGGFEMISRSHLLGPVCGVEKTVGKIDNPVRRIFDYAHEHYLKDLPLMFVLTVTTFNGKDICLEGIYIGDRREVFEQASEDSMKKNITYLEKPVQKVVTYLDEEEFKTTWLGDKAIYRTRPIIRDGGELIILAPGIRQFGDDAETDRVMRKYGYAGRETLLKALDDKSNTDLRSNLAAAGQLILSSSNGRFRITYAVRHLTREEVEGVFFGYLDYDEAVKRYDPDRLSEGVNTMEDGEEIYFIRNPGLGFWTLEQEASAWQEK